MATFDVIGNSYACGESGRTILVPFKYGIGSIVFIKSQARKGIMESVTITDLQFIKNIKTSDKYFVLYNSTWYEDQLCDEACARALAIAYWTRQEEWIMRKLQCESVP